jgi:hypothetical protein
MEHDENKGKKKKIPLPLPLPPHLFKKKKTGPLMSPC